MWFTSYSTFSTVSWDHKEQVFFLCSEKVLLRTVVLFLPWSSLLYISVSPSWHYCCYFEARQFSFKGLSCICLAVPWGCLLEGSSKPSTKNVFSREKEKKSQRRKGRRGREHFQGRKSGRNKRKESNVFSRCCSVSYGSRGQNHI